MKQEQITLPAGMWNDIKAFMANAPAGAYGSTPAQAVAQMLAIVLVAPVCEMSKDQQESTL